MFSKKEYGVVSLILHNSRDKSCGSGFSRDFEENRENNIAVEAAPTGLFRL